MSLILMAVLVAKLPLVVRTYDSAGVSSRTLERAHDSARATLAAIGIEPIWRPCHASGCGSTLEADEVEVRLVTATPLSERGSLGYAAVDVAQRAGTLATVYVDRIDTLARQAGVDPGILLGRAVAHEIGHLILGTTNHARFGLMRATWKTDELRREMPLDWVFSGEQGAEMRVRLAARADSIPLPESIVASARLTARPSPLTGGRQRRTSKFLHSIDATCVPGNGSMRRSVMYSGTRAGDSVAGGGGRGREAIGG